MKKTFLLFLSILSFSYSECQIPNAGFETWIDGNPASWQTSNFNFQYTPVVQVSNSHSGASAMKMQWQNNGLVGANVNCPASDGSGINKFPFAGRPTSMDGWYLSSFGSGDYLKVTGVLYKNGNPIGFATKDIHGSAPNYTNFSLPVTYSVSGNADSASINMILLYTGSADYDSFVLVDDLSFNTNLNGVEELYGNNFSALKLYSDPSAGNLHIEYQCGISGPVKLSVINLNGKVLKTIVNQDHSAGHYSIDVSLASFHEGFYLVEMESIQGARSQKFSVMRK